MSKFLALLAFVAVAEAAQLRSKAPISEKVFLDGTQIWGHNIDESGDCRYPMPSFKAGSFKVCGKYTSVSIYMTSNCQEDYGGHYVTLGPAGADACVSVSPDTHQWMSHMQSYKVTFNTAARSSR